METTEKVIRYNPIDVDKDKLYEEPYCVVDNCLCMKIKRKNGVVIKKLCNFYAYILTEKRTGDPDDPWHSVTVTGVNEKGERLPTIEVGTNEFFAMKWVTRRWGFHCLIEIGVSKDRVRHAIQSTAVHKYEEKG